MYHQEPHTFYHSGAGVPSGPPRPGPIPQLPRPPLYRGADVSHNMVPSWHRLDEGQRKFWKEAYIRYYGAVTHASMPASLQERVWKAAYEDYCIAWGVQIAGDPDEKYRPRNEFEQFSESRTPRGYPSEDSRSSFSLSRRRSRSRDYARPAPARKWGPGEMREVRQQLKDGPKVFEGERLWGQWIKEAEDIFPVYMPDDQKISAIKQFLGAKEQRTIRVLVGDKQLEYSEFRKILDRQFLPMDKIQSEQELRRLIQRKGEKPTVWWSRYIEKMEQYRGNGAPSREDALNDFMSRSNKYTRSMLFSLVTIDDVYQTLKDREQLDDERQSAASAVEIPSTAVAHSVAVGPAAVSVHPVIAAHPPVGPLGPGGASGEKSRWCLFHGWCNHTSEICRELAKNRKLGQDLSFQPQPQSSPAFGPSHAPPSQASQYAPSTPSALQYASAPSALQYASAPSHVRVHASSSPSHVSAPPPPPVSAPALPFDSASPMRFGRHDAARREYTDMSRRDAKREGCELCGGNHNSRQCRIKPCQNQTTPRDLFHDEGRGQD